MAIEQFSRSVREGVESIRSSNFRLDLTGLAKGVPRLNRRSWVLLACIILFSVLASYGGVKHADDIKQIPDHISKIGSSISGIFVQDDDAQPAETGPVVELEGVTMGLPFTNGSTTRQIIGDIKERFAATFADIERNATYNACSIDDNRYDTIQTYDETSPTRVSVGIVAIAINVHNSEAILPAQVVAILEAAAYLIKNRNKVYISVYESDSSDKTNAILADFVAAAQAIGITGIWAVSSRMRNGDNRDRIVMLSEIRNHAIAPLMPYLQPPLPKKPVSVDESSSTLIVVNDVVTCPSDILELVHQQRLQRADMVTGVDWGMADDHPRLYDLWVARGINGALAYNMFENSGIHVLAPEGDTVTGLLNSQANNIHDRWMEGRPVPVYCMWGGMAAFNAALFTKQHLRFRSSITSGWTGGDPSGAMGDWGVLVSEDYLKTDCPGASECEYICRDIWNLKRGNARMVLASQARTTYSTEEWTDLADLVPRTKRHGRDSKGDVIDWDGITMPKTVECIRGRTPDGEYLDVWKEERIRIKPSFSFEHIAQPSDVP